MSQSLALPEGARPRRGSPPSGPGWNTGQAVAISLAAVLAAGLAGASQGPQRPATAAWYASLRKPAITPPGAVIGATWGVLEILMCLTGARLMHAPASRNRNGALAAWWGVVAGLGGFQAVFFGARRPGAGTVVSGAMLAACAGCIALAARTDRVAAGAMTPLAAWLTFATGLSADVWRRNRRRASKASGSFLKKRTKKLLFS